MDSDLTSSNAKTPLSPKTAPTTNIFLVLGFAALLGTTILYRGYQAYQYQKQQQLELEQKRAEVIHELDVVSLQSSFQQVMTYFRDQEGSYPAELTELEGDYLDLLDTFSFDDVTYEITEDGTNYQICFSEELVYNEPCFDKKTFFVDPTLLLPEDTPAPTSDELLAWSDQAIEGIQYWNDDSTDVLRLMTQIYQFAPDSSAFYQAYGWYRFQTGYKHSSLYLPDDFETAEYYSQLSQDSGEHNLGSIRLAFGLNSMAENPSDEKREALFEEIEQYHPDSEWYHYYKVNTNPETKDRIEALTALLDKTENKSILWKGWWYLHNLYYLEGDKEKSLEAVVKIKELFNHPWAYQSISFDLQEKGEYEAAIQELKDGIEAGNVGILHSNLSQAYANYGFYQKFHQEKDYEGALEYLEKALKGQNLDENIPYIYRQVADVYQAKGTEQNSLEDLKTALEYLELAKAGEIEDPNIDQAIRFVTTQITFMELKQ